MGKIPNCDRCQFYSQNPHLVCAVHPNGVQRDTCLDFRPRSGMEKEELWSPTGYFWYGGELIKSQPPGLTREQQLTILNTHPLFTHKCPECGYQYNPNDRPPEHWVCPNSNCDWVGDTV